MFHLRFWGVRGSVPSPGPLTSRYGGNSACVEVRFRSPSGFSVPILFDLGSGARSFSLRNRTERRLLVLLSHTHLDHIQGFSFMPILDMPGAEIDIFGPEGSGLKATMAQISSPPIFPVPLDQRVAKVNFHEVGNSEIPTDIAGLRIVSRFIPHSDRTLGFRVEAFGRSIAYITDHQQSLDPTYIDPGVLELADNCDLLIHDGQYDDEEFRQRPNWGHSTLGYAIEVAKSSGAKRLVIFHHDPDRSDDELDELLGEHFVKSMSSGVPLIGAWEGMELEVE